AKRVHSAVVQPLGASDALAGSPRSLDCDLLAVSGGFSPVIHLQCQAGSRPLWDERLAAFIPGKPAQAEHSAGACGGMQGLQACARDGLAAGIAAAQATGFEVVGSSAPVVPSADPGDIRALWLVPHARGVGRAPKQFV